MSDIKASRLKVEEHTVISQKKAEVTVSINKVVSDRRILSRIKKVSSLVILVSKLKTGKTRANKT